jgi:hypothetical protein
MVILSVMYKYLEIQSIIFLDMQIYIFGSDIQM